MRQNNVHTETCHKSDDTLWNGEWFTIGRRVSPCHSKLFAFQILDTAEFVDDVKHICHTLTKVNVYIKSNDNTEGKSVTSFSITGMKSGLLTYYNHLTSRLGQNHNILIGRNFVPDDSALYKCCTQWY